MWSNPARPAPPPPAKTRKVVVIGTEATVSSHAYAKALQARGVEAKEKACPLLVPLVEEGWAEHHGHGTGGPNLSG